MYLFWIKIHFFISLQMRIRIKIMTSNNENSNILRSIKLNDILFKYESLKSYN